MAKYTDRYITKSATPKDIQKKWFLVDADGALLGRMASKVAKIIRGKHKTNYTPHMDCGDNVVVINAEKVQLSGNKWEAKEYIRHTGYPGGQRSMNASTLLAKHPERLIEKAVKGMLPKNKLGRKLYGNLYVYVGTEHDQEAQKPKKVKLN